MTNIEIMKLAVEWIESQPEPRMIGASKAIAALRQAISETEQREWASLTDDEIAKHWAVDGFYRTPTDFAHAIEAKLKEKNS